MRAIDLSKTHVYFNTPDTSDSVAISKKDLIDYIESLIEQDIIYHGSWGVEIKYKKV